MSLPVETGAGNVELLAPADIARISSLDEVRRHLTRHAAGTATLTTAQLACLDRRQRELVVAERLAAVQPVVHHQPTTPRPTTTSPARRQTGNPKPQTTSTPSTRITAGDKLKGMTRFFAVVERLKLPPRAVAAWCYLWTISTDGRVSTTTGRIGRAIGLSQQSGSRAVDELEDAGLVTTPHHGTGQARSLGEALSTFVVTAPPEPEPETTTQD